MNKIKSVFCAIFGHSRIQTTFFGYYYCGRCGDQLGDTLAGVYPANTVVIKNHNCKVCFKNYKKCSWKDKFLVPYPFERKK